MVIPSLVEGSGVNPEKNNLFWQALQNGESIPGSTRVPTFEIQRYLFEQGMEQNGQGLRMADLGSGGGRSTARIKEVLPRASIVALDLSNPGLAATTSTDLRTQGDISLLPLETESVDIVAMCGVLTSLASSDKLIALDLRARVAKEIHRVLKPNALLVISDFKRPHDLTHYPVNYYRHALITGEVGTIAVFDPTAHVSFRGLTDTQVAQYKDSQLINRFAHHFSPEELLELFCTNGFKVDRYSVERGSTPSGTSIDTIVLPLIKNS